MERDISIVVADCQSPWPIFLSGNAEDRPKNGLMKRQMLLLFIRPIENTGSETAKELDPYFFVAIIRPTRHARSRALPMIFSSNAGDHEAGWS